MKILILHASAGAGHKRAAEALGKAFAAAHPAAGTTVRDILDFTPPLFRRTYARGYLDLVRSAPEVWGYVYARSDRKSREPLRRRIRSIFNQVNAPLFLRFVKDLAPDAVVCTHFMPLELISTARRRRRLDCPLYCVVTDFAVHSLWMVENVDGYYVASEEARRQLVRQGVSADRVRVSGIPIDAAFESRLSPQAARRKLGADPRLATVLMLGGGFGVGPTVELIRAFREATVPCQLLVVAGANEKMRAEAEAAIREIGLRAKVYGFVTNIHELMDAADLVITKPGGLTSSEVLAKGKPMLIVDPIPGQEQRNCEHLLEAGAALRLYDVNDGPWKAAALLADPSRLQEMRRHAEAIARPAAARDIAEDVLKRLSTNGDGENVGVTG